jgi:hypothetical protein
MLVYRVQIDQIGIEIDRILFFEGKFLLFKLFALGEKVQLMVVCEKYVKIEYRLVYFKHVHASRFVM